MKVQFCPYCGTKLDKGARFCKNCGGFVIRVQEHTGETVFNQETKTEAKTPKEERGGEDPRTQRKTVYDGELHKCPNCGEVLNAFAVNCPTCGYEIRGRLNSSAVREFAVRLTSARTQQEKITIIRNFPVPNTKEDIWEFMILASTNVDENLEKEVSAAWKSKIEQAYQKAQILFHDEEFSRIQSTYAQVCKKLATQRKIEKFKQAGNVLTELMPILPNVIAVMGWLISIFVLIPLCKINLDNTGSNSFQLLLIIDFAVGAFLIPYTLKCLSALPKLIAVLGLILSIILLVPLCGRNLDDAGVNAFQLILIVDIICSVTILVRMFKQKHKYETSNITLGGISFVIALICVAILLLIYGIGSVTTDVMVKKEVVSKEQEKKQLQSVTYEWPSDGLNQYLPLPPIEYGEIITDDESRFNIKIYQVSSNDFEKYVRACEEKGFTIETVKTDSTFYAYQAEQFNLDIFYYEDEETMEIYLDAPEKMSEFKWPTSKIAKKLPVLKSLVGYVWSDTSEDFGVNIADMSQKDFSAYVEECMDSGFTVDYKKSEKYFHAYNKAGDELTLSLEVFDVMQIHIETASDN